jgi:hypothetical protein
MAVKWSAVFLFLSTAPVLVPATSAPSEKALSNPHARLHAPRSPHAAQHHPTVSHPARAAHQHARARSPDGNGASNAAAAPAHTADDAAAAPFESTDDGTAAARVDLPAGPTAPPHRAPHASHAAHRGGGPHSAGAGAAHHGAGAGSDHLKRSTLAEGQLVVYAFDPPSDLVALSDAPSPQFDGHGRGPS